MGLTGKSHATASPRHCITASLHHCTTMSVRHCAITSPYHCVITLVSHLRCPLPPNQSVIHVPCPLLPNQSVICLAPCHQITCRDLRRPAETHRDQRRPTETTCGGLWRPHYQLYKKIFASVNILPLFIHNVSKHIKFP